MGFFARLDEDQYDRQYSDNYLFQRMWAYFRGSLRELIGITVLGLVLSVLSALNPILMSGAIDALEQGATTSQKLALMVVALFFTALFLFGVNWLRRRWTARLVGDITARLRKDGMAAAVKRDMAFYDANKSGKLLSRITSDTQEFGQVIMFVSEIVSQVVQAMILIGVLFSRQSRLTFIMLAFLPVVAGVTALLRKLARDVTRQGSRAMAAVNDNIQESVSGIMVAKNFRQEGMIYDEFVGINEQSYNINLRRGMVLALVFPILNTVGGFATASILYLGAMYAVRELIDVSDWYLFMQSVDRFWFPIINISAFWSQFQAGLSAIERIFALVDAENTVKQTDSRPAPQIEGQVEFDDVTFGYDPAQPVLENFNLSIATGENVAFVGHTGAGKSSIIKLLTRFYEFQDGEIRVDGHAIRQFNLQTYRGQIGLVPQMPFLFSGTIADNIRYARQNANDEEIEQVAMSIGGGEWLNSLPDGLNSAVGERGGMLSMGQRQLVALLRILIQKPAIFILDEATASIDPFTEAQIQEALDMILSRSTSIMIAHRLSTVRSADRIVVLKEGRIIEIGDHNELIRQGGHYAELYNTYFRHQSLNYIEQAKQRFGDAAK